MADHSWQTLYVGKGGPVFIGDISQFMNWRGGEVLSQSWIIHYYGKLIAGLPKHLLSYDPEQWHQYQNFSSLEEAGVFVKKLIVAAKEIAPGAKILSSPDNLEEPDCALTGPVCFTMKDIDSNLLVLTLSKGTDYTLISHKVHTEHKILFNKNSTALFFPMESNGFIHIGMTDDCSSIIIMQCWTAREDLIAHIKAITEKTLYRGSENIIQYNDEILLIVDSLSTHKTLSRGNPFGNGLIQSIKPLLKKASVIDLLSCGKEKTGYAVKIIPGMYSYHFFCKEHNAPLEDDSYSFICLKIDNESNTQSV